MKKLFVTALSGLVMLNGMEVFCQTSKFAGTEKMVSGSIPGVPRHYNLYMSSVNRRNDDLSIPIAAKPGYLKATDGRPKFVELPNSVKLEYVEQGNATGIPVIFLHGISDSWHSFELVLPHLPESIHAFAISQRGHGDSEQPMSGYHTKDFAADIKAFMDKLNIGPAIIVGHSMGSTVAQRFVLDYPEQARALVLIGTFAKYSGNAGVSELEAAVSSMKDPIDASFAKEFQQSTLVKPIPPEYFNTVVNESLKLPARVWKSIVAEWGDVDHVAGLKKYDRPTLIIWGEKDSYCPRADQDILAGAIPNSQLLVYEGTGHAVHWEEPKRFAEELMAFLKRVGS
jgi:non-heme chloroperoxidase